jgi:hypothetical protein
MFEQQSAGGIVTFITASSFVAGPGFVGVREVMRKTFDEIWIIDLGGDNLGTRKTPNVFNIQTPVAISIGVRGKKENSTTPAKVHYAKVDAATREGKLAALDMLEQFSSLTWRECPTEWKSPFLPIGKGYFFKWIKLEDIFPWHYNGTQWFRGWTVAPTEELLRERVRQIIAANGDAKKNFFKESAHRKINKRYASEMPGGGAKPVDALVEADVDDLNITRFGWRSYHRAWAIVDARFGDRLRKPLWETISEKQIFLTSLTAVPLGEGPAIQSTIFLPDCHIVRGSYGGRDVFPLYRDAAGTEPNVTAGLLAVLGQEYGTTPSAEDLAAYVYALLGGQSYTRRFWNELETPGPRVPMTKDGATFADAAKLGRKLIWLHTYAARFQDASQGDEVPIGKATTIKGVSSAPAHYPAEYAYDPAKREITVGDGRFGPIAPEVWEFEVSGLKVVQSWLGYRMKKRAGKKSSPLDDIRPERWTARMSDEFLELLWVLEGTLAMELDLAAALDKVVSGPCFAASDLPQPTAAERKAPGATSAAGDLLALLEDDADDDDD